MRDLRLRMPFAAAALTVGALALPAAADAAVTFNVDAVTDPAHTALNVTDDGTTPTLGDSMIVTVGGNGHYFVGATDTLLAVDPSVNVNITGSANNDTIDASALINASYTNLTIDGGAGDDTIVGGGTLDTLHPDQVHGGAGNDRVDGGKGPDDQFGDAGNDTLIWNAGDANDTSDGGANFDVVEINGATGPIGDAITVQPSTTVANAVHIARTNLIAFTVDATTSEKIVVNGFAGDDTISGAPGVGLATPSLQIDGGPGNDAITGGDGNDTLLGGDDVDTLSGGAGDDMIAGGRGNDTMNGGAGDDILSWSNGDGTDIANGDAGFDTTQVIEGSVADVNTLAPNGARTMFNRTSAAAFAMDMDTEALSLQTFGGDDSLAVAPGVTQTVVADGGSGNDTFTGGDESDTFFGGLGDDHLDGGPGSDLLDGGDGNDALAAFDHNADLVRGGAGNDSASVDNSDAVSGVESPVNTDLPPAPVTTTVTVTTPVPTPVKALAATVTTGSVKLVLSHGHWLAKLPVSCPAAETGGCKATVTLWTAKAVKLGGVTAPLALGSKKVSLKPGQKGSVTVTLVSGVAKLARKGKLAARAVVSTTDANGNGASASRSVSLALPAAKKAKK